MHVRQRALSIAAVCVGIFAHGSAIAQSYFVSYSNLSVASCDSSHIQGTVTAAYLLPSSANNLVAFVSINGGPAVTTFYTQSPPNFSGPYGLSYPIPTTAQPYTISATVYPAQNGAPTGSGVHGAYTCNLDGTLSGVFTPAAAAPLAGSIPTLSEWGLTALALLLGLGAMVQIGRKDRRANLPRA